MLACRKVTISFSQGKKLKEIFFFFFLKEEVEEGKATGKSLWSSDSIEKTLNYFSAELFWQETH